jgi:protein SCO1/2
VPGGLAFGASVMGYSWRTFVLGGPGPPKNQFAPPARRFCVALIIILTMVCGGCAKRYTARGVVLRAEPVTAGGARVTISHEPIPGYMDAMVMPFTMRPRSLGEGLAPGDRVEFRLRVTREESWVDRLAVISAKRPDVGLARSPMRPTLVDLGATAPDITLTDHHGREVTLASLRGQAVAITFIYTRCPLPDYCPRMLANFKAVRARFADRLGKDLTLLVVTFDPQYDTVETLNAYARAHAADVPGWRFLTGPLSEITRMCEAFGIEFWPEEGLLSHTLQTAVLDRDGRLAGTIEGTAYSGRQLGDLIASVIDPRVNDSPVDVSPVSGSRR